MNTHTIKSIARIDNLITRHTFFLLRYSHIYIYKHLIFRMVRTENKYANSFRRPLGAANIYIYRYHRYVFNVFGDIASSYLYSRRIRALDCSDN